MKEIFEKFFKKWNGKPCEVNDPSNINQCMDLAYAFCDELGVTRDTIRHLYASEIYTKPNDLTVKFFELIPNTAMFVPKVGDICIFKGGTAGHVSIANGEGDTNTFKSFDQNWNTTADDKNNKCLIIAHAYDNLLGVLRFRMPTAPAEITDQTILPIKDENNNFMEVQAVRGRLSDNVRTINSQIDQISELEADVLDLEESWKIEENINKELNITNRDLFNRIVEVKKVVNGKGWTWTKVNAIKKLLN